MSEITVDLDLKKSFITKQKVFSQLNESEIEQLAKLLTEVRVSPGKTIVTEGDRVDNVYLIVSGTAEVQHLSIKDNAIHVERIADLPEGAAIGLNETGFYSLTGVRTATVVAKTEMLLLRLSVAQFHGFALSSSRVAEIMRSQARIVEDPNAGKI